MSQYESLEELDLRQIMTFLTSVNTKSFSKTAKKLYMTQSMVSKDMAAMEQSLGIQIFYRTPKGIELTEAGAVLYQDWKDLPDDMARTISKAKVLQGESKEQIIICDFYASLKKEYLWPYVDKYKDIHPNVDIVLETREPGMVLEQLEHGACDIAFVPMCEMPDFKEVDIDCKTVLHCTRSVWVHKSNPLYARNQIKLEDLKNETFIVVTPNHSRSVFELCQTAGFSPQKLWHSASINSATMDLRMGKGIIIRDMIFDSTAAKDIKIFELSGTKSGTVMAWRKQTPNENVHRFIKMYKAL